LHQFGGSRQWCARVIFVKSESQDLRVRGESESSKIFSIWVRGESWLGRVEQGRSHKNCRVTSSHGFASSSQCQSKWNWTFFLCLFFATNWRPTCYEMAPDKLKNGSQCCFSKFDWTVFTCISKFFVNADCILLVSFTLSQVKSESHDFYLNKSWWCLLCRRNIYYVRSYCLILCWERIFFNWQCHSQSLPQVQPNLATSVATTQLSSCWMCDSPHTRCAWKAKTNTYGANKEY